ncbi:MAG: hypothetical protein UT94_C0061G0007 [Candidatus Uhrbacteria bacterium GW2011_GWF2_40_263]|nr:MAG: hypothetical protein UT94_C0061G0007 [Candidatus Uhrbacteria bacterium GW2011_GWF2_40_263]
MHLKRALLADEIVVEFLLPKKSSSKVMIFCNGLPSGSEKQTLLKKMSRLGYWVFHLRYRGTWESTGNFLDHAPEKDVWDVIEAIKKGFVDVWEKEEYQIDPSEVIVVGASFGGTVAILSTKDPRVQKAIAFSPVVDWTQSTPEEPMDYLEEVIHSGYAGVYRFSQEDWMRLSRGEFFQPMAEVADLDREKIFVIQAKDDSVVPFDSVQRFVSVLGCQHLFLRTGGHLSTSLLTSSFRSWRLARQVKHFLHS